MKKHKLNSMPPFFKRAGQVLREGRQMRGLTMDEVAERLGDGFCKSMLSQVEAGKNRMQIDNFLKLMKFYRINPLDVFEPRKICRRCRGTGKL